MFLLELGLLSNKGPYMVRVVRGLDGVQNPAIGDDGQGNLHVGQTAPVAEIDSIVGIARVTKTAYQDPTTDDDRWVVVDVAPVKPLAEPVTLARIKADPALRKLQLVTHSRLSVMPIPEDAYRRILELGKKSSR
jgi:hypothetical protein